MSLRNPDFGNRWRTQFNTVVHRNHAQQLREFQRPVEFIEERFDFTISANTQVDVDAFLTDFNTNLGHNISYTDFEGTVWTGYIDPESVTIKRGMIGCNLELTFNLVGSHANNTDLLSRVCND